MGRKEIEAGKCGPPRASFASLGAPGTSISQLCHPETEHSFSCFQGLLGSDQAGGVKGSDNRRTYRRVSGVNYKPATFTTFNKPVFLLLHHPQDTNSRDSKPHFYQNPVIRAFSREEKSSVSLKPKAFP